MYCHPLTHEPLTRKDDFLVGERSGARFPIEDGMPIFLIKEDLAGLNGRYQRLYNRIAPLYDFFLRAGYRLMGRGSEGEARWEYLQELEVKDGDRVLETSIGNGWQPQVFAAGRYLLWSGHFSGNAQDLSADCKATGH